MMIIIIMMMFTLPRWKDDNVDADDDADDDGGLYTKNKAQVFFTVIYLWYKSANQLMNEWMKSLYINKETNE